MKLELEYCGVWNYEPRAVGLAAKIKQKFGLELHLQRSGGGVYEFQIDQELIWSKKKTGEFPTDEYIYQEVQKRQ